jgi:hypothetical protein
MEPNRFDDVETRIVEEPAPPRPRRHHRRIGHAAIAITAAAVLAGSLAAGASALTSTAQAPTREAAKSQSFNKHGWAGKRDGKCRRGDRDRSSASFSY